MAFKAMKVSSLAKPSLTLRNKGVFHRNISTVPSSNSLKKLASFSNQKSTPLCTNKSTNVLQRRNYSTFPDPNVNLTEEQVMLRDTALRFALEKLEPNAAKWDEEQIFPVDVLKEAAQLGFGAIYVPDDVGGSGMGRTEAAVIFEAMSGYCVSTTAYISIHNMCAGLIDKFGTPEQRKHYLPKLANMDLLASYCLTEPGSGSDAASLVTKAVRQGNHFVLNGSKAFISGAGDTDVYLIMVRTGDNTPNGISCVLVEKGTPGLSFGKKEQKMGWNSQPTRAVIMEDCKIPVTNLIGKEGEGFKIAMKALDGGRINIAACSLGAAQRCNDIAKDYIKGRKQFGKPLASFQAMQFQLAEMACSINASRLMVRQAANMMDAQDPNASPYCAMAKLFTCDASYKVVDNALQMHGGYGYLKDYPVERFLRDIRVHRILEGTDAVMRMIIARNALKD